MDVKTVAIMLLCVVVVGLMWCNEPAQEARVQVKHDTIVKQVERVIERTKVLRHRDTVMVVRYRAQVDTIISQAPDTCEDYIVAVQMLCDSVIAVKDSVIISQDTAISKLQKLEDLNNAEMNKLRTQRKITRLVGLVGVGIIFLRGLFTLI